MALRQDLSEILKLENDADEVMNEALATLYDGVTEVAGVIHAWQWGTIYEFLEDSTDRGKHVVRTVEWITDERSR